MELISNILNKIKAKSIFNSDHIQVININGYTAIQENDMVICIPYLIESNEIIMRYENIPPFNLIKPEIDKYITVMSTVINNNEYPKDALLRGLNNEFGIILNEQTNIEILYPIFINKGNTARYHICILPLMNYQYEQTYTQDQAQQMLRKDNNVKLHINDLNNYIIYDLITRYTLDLFKKEYSLF